MVFHCVNCLTYWSSSLLMGTKTFSWTFTFQYYNCDYPCMCIFEQFCKGGVHFTCWWLLPNCPKTKAVFTNLDMSPKCLTILVFLLIFSSFFQYDRKILSHCSDLYFFVREDDDHFEFTSNLYFVNFPFLSFGPFSVWLLFFLISLYEATSSGLPWALI